MSTGNIVKLDVGGTIYKTLKSTLTKFDGFFKTMLETEIPITKSDCDAIFIDRDPTHFRLILNFMRDGKIVLPNAPEDVKEIQNEAQYYLLEDLVRMCGPVETKDSIVESDAELRRIVNSEKPTIIIRQGAHSSTITIDQEGAQGLLVILDTIVSTIQKFPESVSTESSYSIQNRESLQYTETRYCTRQEFILKLLNDLVDFMIETGRCQAEIGSEIREELIALYQMYSA